MSTSNVLVEHVAEQIAAAAEGLLSFGQAVVQVEQVNAREGFEVDGRTVRLSDEDFLAAVALVLAWHRDTRAAPDRYFGRAALASYLGVPRSTLASWLRRYRHAEPPPPTPDVHVVEPGRRKAGWSPARARQMHEWVCMELPRLRRVGGWPAGRSRRTELVTDG